MTVAQSAAVASGSARFSVSSSDEVIIQLPVERQRRREQREAKA